MTRGSKTVKCLCEGYPFPHRLGGGRCIFDQDGVRKGEPYEPDDMTLAKQQKEAEDEHGDT